MSKITYKIEDDVVYVITDCGDGTSAFEEVKSDAPEYEEVLKLAKEANQ